MLEESSIFSLQGKKILVLGGSRGIGAELSRGLGELGVEVLALGRSQSPIALFERVFYKSCDAGDLMKLDEVVREWLNGTTLDGVIVSLGVSISSETEPNELSRYTKTIQNNLITPFAALDVLRKYMRQASIILVSSINSTMAFSDNPGYVASKAGLSGLGRALALDWHTDNHRVNILSLGYFPTDMTKLSYQDAKKHEERAKKTILNRWGDLSELLGPTVFLLSEASSYIVGQSLVVDGGWSVKGL